jgi:MoaA/NifB/PqqE/SkfB family radical SAM enzyme
MGITERIDNITGIPDQYRHEIVPAPKSVKIELTGRCNYKCTFCARSLRLRDQKEMDKKTFRRLLGEMKAAGVEEIGMFYLGESFMCKWLPEAIHMAKKEFGFPYVFLTTNGSISTPERIEACIRAGLDSLKFSMNYADELQFAEITQTPVEGFRVMIDNTKMAKAVRDKVEKETGHRCGLYASYIKYTDDQGDKIKAVMNEVTPFMDEVYPLPLYNQADLVGEYATGKDWAIKAGNPGRFDNMREPLPCWSIFTEGHITWDGYLSACCFDHDGRFHMADLNKVKFMEGWNSVLFQELRGHHLRKNVCGTACEQCVAYN